MASLVFSGMGNYELTCLEGKEVRIFLLKNLSDIYHALCVLSKYTLFLKLSQYLPEKFFYFIQVFSLKVITLFRKSSQTHWINGGWIMDF